MSEPVLDHGEDVISAPCNSDIQALAAVFRASDIWEEVVPGMADLTVKYDPLKMTREEAGQKFRQLWRSPIKYTTASIPPAFLTAGFDYAPDLPEVAGQLGTTADAFPCWLAARRYQVVMMGFQPGLPYLEDVDGEGLPLLSRLDTPRQHVPAGSIGFVGRRACIYPFDAPGGWPIVGRVSEAIFRRDHLQPFLLQPGQIVRFQIA